MATTIGGTSDSTSSNGNGHGSPHGFGQRVETMGEGAQMFWSQARGIVDDVSSKLDIHGRMERNPYGTLLAAAGIGYVLGGGLFTPLTGKLVRLGLRLAALPLVKDELVGMATQLGSSPTGYSGGTGYTGGGSEPRGV